MNTVVSLLLLIVCSSFKNTSDYAISYYLLSNISHICDVSRSDVCENAGVSTRVLSMFCSTLGYKNYSDLKLALIKTIDIRKLQMKVHFNNADLDKIINVIYALSNVGMDHARFIQTIDQINAYIYDCKKVIIVGAVYPEMLSLHYMEDMLMMRKFIHSSPVNTSIGEVENDTLVLMISFTGRVYIEHYDEIMKFKEHNVSIVGIGNPNSLPEQIHLTKYLELPFKGDVEIENACIPLVLQYMKYRYYQTYGDTKHVCI